MSELTPYICVQDSRAAIEWYVSVRSPSGGRTGPRQYDATPPATTARRAA
jgi:hypothetical protein